MSFTQQPSLAGFGEAQDRKRTLMGSDVTFLYPAVVTFPPGTALSPETGLPFDPTIVPSASAQASASVRVGAFFKAVNRGGAAGADLTGPIGRDEKTRVFLAVNIADRSTVESAVEFILHGDRFQIYAIKDDEPVNGYRRVLVYGAGEGVS